MVFAAWDRYSKKDGKKETMTKVSLIIPVHNKAKFLERCLDSVLKQNRESVQVIVVDDGSTDGSAEICDKYGFETYHTENQGVSAARNLGISKAEGDYVAFLDADDFLAKNALESMVKNTQSGYNIYQFGQYRLRNCANFNEKLVLPHRSPDGMYNLDYIPKYWVQVWNKMYKLSFLHRHRIQFKAGMQFGEDALFNARCILANNGFYHAPQATVYHILDDKNSLCRGKGMTLERVELLDQELNKLYSKQTTPAKRQWLMTAINEHRHSKLFNRLGFNKGFKGKYDVVYLVKESAANPELVYSLRSLEANWPYKSVWFCGGCPEGIKPDRQMKIKQAGLNKWEKVRNMLFDICRNNELTENFWLFNDDFFVLKKMNEDMPPQYNGRLLPYVERVEKKIGGPDGFTVRLRQAHNDLVVAGLDTLNYEVHKPMLFNRAKLLTVLEKFPHTPAYRSIYGNYWRIMGQDRHDMKIKKLHFSKMYALQGDWEFVSTSDKSFNEGEVGEYIRNKFNKISRFEKEAI